MNSEVFKEIIQMRAEKDDTQDLAEQQKEALANEFTDIIQSQAIHDDVGYYRKSYKIPKKIKRQRRKECFLNRLRILLGIRKTNQSVSPVASLPDGWPITKI